MTVTNYFTLTNSTDTLSKQFMVLQSGYSPIKEKSMSVKKTLKGRWDVSQGAIYERHEYIIRVREEDEDPWGTTHDLDTFFSYNNPNPPLGQPSSKLTMTDHFGAEHTVIMAGEFAPQTISAMVEGPNALFFIKVVFLFLASPGGSGS